MLVLGYLWLSAIPEPEIEFLLDPIHLIFHSLHEPFFAHNVSIDLQIGYKFVVLQYVLANTIVEQVKLTLIITYALVFVLKKLPFNS